MPQMKHNIKREKSGIIKICFPAVSMIFLFLISCSNRNMDSVLNPSTGTHYGNWVVDHRINYLGNKIICTGCHGSDLKGGTSGIGCFSAASGEVTCHPKGPPSRHQEGWRSPANHGASAKSAPGVDPGSRTGFERCKMCHGTDFSGGIAQRSCFTCHGVSAPHPKKPWKNDRRTHVNTDTANMVVCLACHADGANSSHKPDIPAHDGTPPGCYNGTLCHSEEHNDES
ncbi:MAG: hypothetical protein AB1498_05915 [bacterium]